MIQKENIWSTLIVYNYIFHKKKKKITSALSPFALNDTMNALTI